MIGGGFAASDVFEYALFALADYPSSPTSWTVTASSISQFSLTAEVYCLPASPTLGVRIVRARITGTGSVSCPAGTVLLGGGFSGGEQAAAGSRPTPSDPADWYAAVDGAGAQVYALCAGQRVSAGSLASATFNPHSSTTGEQPASGGASCPAGATATGGGFNGSLIVGSQRDSSVATGWSVEAGGDSPITVYALCVRFAA